MKNDYQIIPDDITETGNSDLYPDAILQSFEVKKVLDSAFYQLLRPLMSTFKTSDIIMKMVEMHRHRRDVVCVGMGMIVYRDCFVISLLGNSQLPIAFEAFMRGKKVGCSLMECGFQGIDSIVNSFGIVQTKNASRFSKQFSSSFLKDDAKRKILLQQLNRLARENVFVSPGAIWYNETEDKCLIFDYNKVNLADNETKDGFIQYQDNWARFLG